MRKQRLDHLLYREIRDKTCGFCRASQVRHSVFARSGVVERPDRFDSVSLLFSFERPGGAQRGVGVCRIPAEGL